MAGSIQRRSQPALWWGLLIAVLGLLSNGLYFAGVPAAPIPWISLFLPVVGLILVLTGLWRAFARSSENKGKVWASAATILSVLILVFSVAAFILSRRLPPPTAATPQVGQRVPDFTLADSTGHSVALSELLSAPAAGAPPKAVLLVFYRGYW